MPKGERIINWNRREMEEGEETLGESDREHRDSNKEINIEGETKDGWRAEF